MTLSNRAYFGTLIDRALPTDVPASSAFGTLPPVVLILSGSLCPVHRSHVTLLHAAKHLLEAGAGGQPPRRVLSGLLVPSSDGYVKGKLGTDWIPLEQRVALCRAAIADDGADWIGVAPWGIASGSNCGQMAVKELTEAHEELKRRRATNQEAAAAHPPAAGYGLAYPSVTDRFGAVEALTIYGSDFLVRCPGCLRKATFILSRQDSDGTAVEGERLVAEARANGILHPRFTLASLATHDEAACVIPELSSTLVRNLLREIAQPTDNGNDNDSGGGEDQRVGIAQRLTTLLHPSVVRMLLDRDRLESGSGMSAEQKSKAEAYRRRKLKQLQQP